MKAVYRITPPSCLDNNNSQVREKKERLYKTDDPWKGFTERKSVCDELLNMFGRECAFCGKLLYSEDSDTQVDHFLPKGKFKLISLCWENMILLCSNCNNKKRDYSPESLDGKIFIEPFAKDATKIPQNAEIYNRYQVLSSCMDRLIEPSFDNPSEHIRFDPASRQYEPLSPIGELMNKRIFNRKKARDEQLMNLSNLVKVFVENTQNTQNPGQTRDELITCFGYSFFIHEFYKYWSEIKEKRSASGDAVK